MKPYYQDSACTIYHGDCREILPHLPKVDLVLTDPPYGEVNRSSNGLRSLHKGGADVVTVEPGELASLLIPRIGGSAYVWCGAEQVSELRAMLVEAGMSTRLCVWRKTNPSPMNGEYIWLSGLEVCVFGKISGAVFNEFCKVPAWDGPSDSEISGHPTPKPQWLMNRLVSASSNTGNTILDPFMGSGTTLRAAKDLGRKSIGIEIEEKYCEIAAKRLAQEVFAL